MGIDAVGSGGPSQIQSAEDLAPPTIDVTQDAAEAAQVTLQADPQATQAAWAAHQTSSAAGAIAEQVGGTTATDDVVCTPDWMTMDEFYASMPEFIQALDGALERVAETLQASRAEAALATSACTISPEQLADLAPAAGGDVAQQAGATQQADATQQAGATQQADLVQQANAAAALSSIPSNVTALVRRLAHALAQAPPPSDLVRSIAEQVDAAVLDWVSGGDAAQRAEIGRHLGDSTRGGGAVGGELSPSVRDATRTPEGYGSLDAARAGNYVRNGSSGPQVRALQEALNRSGIQPQVEVNGTFGPEMQEAVRNFQAANGCSVDGIVGPETMGALDAALGLPRRSAPSPGGGGGIGAPIAAPVAPGQSNRRGALQAAIGQMGVREATGNNDGVPAQRYSNGRNVPWCANFVSWSFRQAGTPLPGNQVSLGSCDYMMNQFKSNNMWFDRGAGTPQPGDVIMFGVPGDSTHVGIVESVGPDGKINTVEGNSGNRVTRRSYDPNSSRILGYGRP